MSEDNVYYNLRMSTETNSKPALTQSELSELFNQECNPISQSTISKIETNKKIPPTKSPEVIKAYCEHFGVTSDFLLGLRDVKTTNEDIAMICKYTGLSEEAIERISDYGEQQKEILNALITGVSNDIDCLLSLLTSLWFYSINAGSSTLTVNNYLYGDTTIDDRQTVNNMLKYDVSEHLDFILHTVRELFISKKDEIRKLKDEELELRIELEAKKQGITSDELKAQLKESIKTQKERK